MLKCSPCIPVFLVVFALAVASAGSADAQRALVFPDGLYLQAGTESFSREASQAIPTIAGTHEVAGCAVDVRENGGAAWFSSVGLTCLGVEPFYDTVELVYPNSQPMLNWSVRPPRGVIRVVIDPGHGGKDAGAVGLAEMPEKDIALGIAKRLAEQIGGLPEVEVYLTRTDDQYLSLRDRSTIANRLQADLFLSIHANSGRRDGARGVEVFVAGQRADDQASMAVAAAENAGEEAYVASYYPTDLLSELALADQLQHSALAANSILNAMTETLQTDDRGVKQAPFWVLLGSNMPAVLIESGFVTNPEEGFLLAEARYQARIASAIADALKELQPIFLARREDTSNDKIAQSRGTGTSPAQVQSELAP